MSAGEIERSNCLAWSCRGGSSLYNHDSTITGLRRFCVAARNSCLCCIDQSLSSCQRLCSSCGADLFESYIGLLCVVT